jgi:hypothetical protein
MSYDLELIKGMLPEYLERIGTVITKRTETHLECHCPLHADTSPSFSADLIAGVWVWKCWPCNLGGTVIDLHADLHGLPRHCLEAIHGPAEVLGISDSGDFRAKSVTDRGPVSSIAKSIDRPPKNPLPENFEAISRVVRSRVYESEEIQREIAGELGASPETIRSLTFTSDALGWSAKHQRPLYVYESGIKIRNAKGSKVRFQWLVGRAVKPWRAHHLDRREVSRVFLTEGESDAVALIDAGLEILHPEKGEVGTAIIASPGTSFKAEWAELLAGKDLVLCMDRDTAGDTAARKIAGLCKPFTNSISLYSWPMATLTI